MSGRGRPHKGKLLEALGLPILCFQEIMTTKNLPLLSWTRAGAQTPNLPTQSENDRVPPIDAADTQLDVAGKELCRHNYAQGANDGWFRAYLHWPRTLAHDLWRAGAKSFDDLELTLSNELEERPSGC
jgi:hypothetical protein